MLWDIAFDEVPKNIREEVRDKIMSIIEETK
jgi:hypothetical protein